MQNNSTEQYLTPQRKTNNVPHYVLPLLCPLVANTPPATTQQNSHIGSISLPVAVVHASWGGEAGTGGHPMLSPSSRPSIADTVKKPSSLTKEATAACERHHGVSRGRVCSRNTRAAMASRHPLPRKD